MIGFGDYLLTAVALMLIIEGLIYALFTDAARGAMLRVLTLPAAVLRNAGMVMIGVGAILLGLLVQFGGR